VTVNQNGWGVAAFDEALSYVLSGSPETPKSLTTPEHAANQPLGRRLKSQETASPSNSEQPNE